MSALPELLYLIDVRNVLKEYLLPAAEWAETPAGARIQADRDIIDVLPISLANAGFKVSVNVDDGLFLVSLRYRRNEARPTETFAVRGTGPDHYMAFANAYANGMRWLNRAVERVLEPETEEAA